MAFRTVSLSSMLLFFLSSHSCAVEDQTKSRIDQTKPLARAFMKELMSELTSAVKKGGPAHAIGVCKEVSAEAEKEFKEKNPEILRFRRISLKPRNPLTHTPTEQERDWLSSTEKLHREGENLAPGSIEGSTTTTVLMPIVLRMSLCLRCHGDPSTFPEDLKGALEEHYPKDRAVGYKKGDFRGALAVKWKKPTP